MPWRAHKKGQDTRWSRNTWTVKMLTPCGDYCVASKAGRIVKKGWL